MLKKTANYINTTHKYTNTKILPTDKKNFK